MDTTGSHSNLIRHAALAVRHTISVIGVTVRAPLKADTRTIAGGTPGGSPRMGV
jgi:hypothetical protein